MRDKSNDESRIVPRGPMISSPSNSSRRSSYAITSSFKLEVGNLHNTSSCGSCPAKFCQYSWGMWGKGFFGTLTPRLHTLSLPIDGLLGTQEFSIGSILISIRNSLSNSRAGYTYRFSHLSAGVRVAGTEVEMVALGWALPGPDRWGCALLAHSGNW